MLIMQLTARKDSFSLRIKSLDEQALKTSLMLELHYESAARTFVQNIC